MPDATFNPDAWLAGTPYLVPNDEAGRERFSKALWESYEAKKDVIAVRRSPIG